MSGLASALTVQEPLPIFIWGGRAKAVSVSRSPGWPQNYHRDEDDLTTQSSSLLRTRTGVTGMCHDTHLCLLIIEIIIPVIIFFLSPDWEHRDFNLDLQILTSAQGPPRVMIRCSEPLPKSIKIQKPAIMIHPFCPSGGTDLKVTGSRSGWATSWALCQDIRSWQCSSEVKSFSSLCKALSLIPSTSNQSINKYKNVTKRNVNTLGRFFLLSVFP